MSIPPQLLSILPIALILMVNTTQAELQLAPLLRDGAVFQREAPIPIWGTAESGKTITVEFANQTKVAKADDVTGKWLVRFDSLPASTDPRSLVVSDGNTKLAIKNVLVGEVWLAAGQSNMAMRVDRAHGFEQAQAEAELPELRVFTVSRHASPEPAASCTGEWVASAPDTIGQFSATGFYFAHELHRELKVPVGLIVAAWGGSTIEAWTSKESQAKQPELRPLLKSWSEKDADYTHDIESAANAKYEQEFAAWKTERKKAIEAGEDPPKAPRRPVNPRRHHHHPAALFNGMIAPLIPYAIQGGIWYQGESNAFTEETAALYELQLPLLVNDWRTHWGQGDFSFAWIQLPPSRANKVAWARIRESMRRATVLANTGMAVTIDLGEEPLLLHPKNKQAYAHRLARWARAEVYGNEIPWAGPKVIGHRAGEKGVLLRFDDPHSLAPKDVPLKGFEVQDDQGQWHPASARVRPTGIALTAKGVTHPKAARYAWSNNPEANLTDTSGLPASPFTTEPVVFNGVVASKKKRKPAPADLVKVPFEPADISTFPEGTDHLEIFLLLGQSNMKGRGVMPATPMDDPQIVMLHKRTDTWFHARHPLHLLGDPVSFEGADNAGVGPGLSFAKSLKVHLPSARIGLLPCAVGGTSLAKWQKGQRLYEDAVRRAKLALEQSPKGRSRVAGALWLQGEADSGSPDRIAKYPAGIAQLIADLRTDLALPNLPFIACTIGELREGSVQARAAINAVLLDLPNQVPHTACVDSRAFASDIGDSVHFDTATQVRHGKLFAEKYLEITSKEITGKTKPK